MKHILSQLGNVQCLYCSESLKEELWRSEWQGSWGEHHYKSLKCDDCGKKNWVKTDFPGSGHDAVLRKDTRTLESVVRRVGEK